MARSVAHHSLTLLGLAMLGLSGGLPGSALAQDGQGMGDSFRTSLQSVSQSIAAGGGVAAQQQALALARSASQPLEKYSAGSLMLQAAIANNDLQGQRIALNFILESGVAPAARVPGYRAAAGILSEMLGEKKDAVAQISYANTLGYATVESQIALADAQFQLGNTDAANTSLEQATALLVKNGKPVSLAWYDRAIALYYKAKRFDLVDVWTQRKLETYGDAENWRSGVVNYITGAELGPDQSLDLYRLMAATDSLASERDWQAYSTIAAQSGTAAEAKAALDTGIKNGDLTATDPNVQKALVVLKPKAAKSQVEIAALTAKAKNGSGIAALEAADAQFAAASFPAAVTLYKTAISRGSIDTDRATTRLGIALARSGDLAGGKTTLAQITTGAWAPVAHFWTVWIDRQQKLLSPPA